MGLKWLVNRGPKYWQCDGKERGKGNGRGEGGTKIPTERNLRLWEGESKKVWKGDQWNKRGRRNA